MGLVLIVFALALIFAALGFAAPVFWLVAAVVFAVWLAGFFMRSGAGARWYRW